MLSISTSGGWVPVTPKNQILSHKPMVKLSQLFEMLLGLQFALMALANQKGNASSVAFKF